MRKGDLEGVLTGREIVNWFECPKIEDRLIVTPLLNPSETIGVSSVDVRLGNQFIVMKRESFALLDIGGEAISRSSIRRYQERLIIPYGRDFLVHPGQLVIGSTLEYIQIPRGLMAYVIGKSTWGRMGLIIATATKIDPGYRGCVTLEIVNHGEIPLALYPGTPIAQLVLHKVASDRVYNGTYSCALGPEFPKFEQKRTAWRFWSQE